MEEDVSPPDIPKERRKTLSPFYKANDEGGYGNPPVSHQRKKGDKGGPGRKPGSTTLEAALRRAFRRKIPVVRDGRLQNLHPTDVFAQRIVETILSGNLSRATIELGQWLLGKYGPQLPTHDPIRGNFQGFSTDEKMIFGALLARSLRGVPSEDGRQDEPGRFPLGEFRIVVRIDGYIGIERIEMLESKGETR